MAAYSIDVTLTIFRLRFLKIFESEKWPKLQFLGNLVEFRVQKGNLLVGTQCPK